LVLSMFIKKMKRSIRKLDLGLKGRIEGEVEKRNKVM